MSGYLFLFIYLLILLAFINCENTHWILKTYEN